MAEAAVATPSTPSADTGSAPQPGATPAAPPQQQTQPEKRGPITRVRPIPPVDYERRKKLTRVPGIEPDPTESPDERRARRRRAGRSAEPVPAPIEPPSASEEPAAQKAGLEFQSEDEARAFVEKMSKAYMEGHPFESQADFESFVKYLVQQHKSLRGMHKSMEAKAARADQALNNLNLSNKAATEWRAEALKLREEVAQLRGQGADPSRRSGEPAPHPQASQDAGATPHSAVDWQVFQEMYSQDPMSAVAWINQTIEDSIENRIESKINAMFAPQLEKEQEQRQQAERQEKFNSLLDSFMLDRDPNGEPTFPELNDPKSAFAIMNIWANYFAEAGEAFRLSPQAIMSAISLYRVSDARQKRLFSSNTTTPEQVVATAQQVTGEPAPTAQPPLDVGATVGDPSKATAITDRKADRNARAASLASRVRFPNLGIPA